MKPENTTTPENSTTPAPKGLDTAACSASEESSREPTECPSCHYTNVTDDWYYACPSCDYETCADCMGACGCDASN